MEEPPPGMVSVSEAMGIVGVGRSQIINLLNSGRLVGTPRAGTGNPRFVDQVSAESYAKTRPSKKRESVRDLPQELGRIAQKLEGIVTEVERASESLGIEPVTARVAGSGAELEGGSAARAIARLQDLVARKDAQIEKLKEAADQERRWREAAQELILRGERFRELYRDAYRG